MPSGIIPALPVFSLAGRFGSLGYGCTLRLKCDATRAETRFRLSAKRTSPFKLAEGSVQSATGSRGVRISGSNAGYTMFRGSVKVLATHSIRQFPLRFLSSASPCAITFQLASTTVEFVFFYMIRTTARDDFPTQLSPIGLSDVNPPCSL